MSSNAGTQTFEYYPKMITPKLVVGVPGKTAGDIFKFKVGVETITQSCGSNTIVRIVPDEIGDDFYKESTIDEIFEGMSLCLIQEVGECYPVQTDSQNNGAITVIHNSGLNPDTISGIQFTVNGETNRRSVVKLDTLPGSAQFDVTVQQTGFWEWVFDQTPTPQEYTLHPETTPLPIYPSPTPKFKWISDWLATPTPGPTASPTITPSITAGP